MMTPILGIFYLIGSLFYTSTQSDWPPLSAEKISLSPKVGLILHQNVYYLTDFKHFVSIYALIFNPIDPLLYLFKYTWPLIFRKPLDPIGSNFCSLAESAYQKFDEVPPPQGGGGGGGGHHPPK